MKNINLIFSILFVIWCLIVLFLCNIEKYTSRSFIRKGFKNKLGLLEFNCFWIFVIATTSFNIIARIFNYSKFYVIGAIGLITFLISHFIILIFFASNGIIRQYYRNPYLYQFHMNSVTLPFIIFGILSSIYCFQEKSSDQIVGRNRSKLRQLFHRYFFDLNYKKITVAFNAAVSFCCFLTFVVTVIRSYVRHNHFQYRLLVLFVPCIPFIFIILAIRRKNTKFYAAAAICWGVIGFVLASHFIYTVAKHPSAFSDDLPTVAETVGNALMVAIHIIIGFISSFTIYRQSMRTADKNKYENAENENFIDSFE